MVTGSTNRGEPLRVAVVGTGFGARVHLPGFLSRADTMVVALCGRSEDKTRDTAARYGVRAVYTDCAAMLADVQPDIVSITAPPATHHDLAVAAFEVGAHVLCEKPLARDVAEAQAMLDAARRHNRVHVVDHEFRYLPARYYQRVLFDQGFVGEPLLLEATFMSAMRWDPDRRWNWWMDADRGGGLLFAIGSHFIDAFRWLTGREVRAVTAQLHAAIPERPLPGGGLRAVTADDSATLVLEMDGGLRGVINLCAVAGGETQRLAVHGSEGALVVENDRRLFGRRRNQDLREVPIPPEYEPPVWVPDENILLGPFVKLVGLMVDTIEGTALHSPPTFADGVAVQRVLNAARESSASGSRVVIPSE